MSAGVQACGAQGGRGDHFVFSVSSAPLCFFLAGKGGRDDNNK